MPNINFPHVFIQGAARDIGLALAEQIVASGNFSHLFASARDADPADLKQLAKWGRTRANYLHLNSQLLGYLK